MSIYNIMTDRNEKSDNSYTLTLSINTQKKMHLLNGKERKYQTI